MSVETNSIFVIIALGLGASFGMDIWNLFLKRVFKIPSLNYCLLGRWLCFFPEGIFIHANITTAQQKPYECAIGWFAHYSIGVVFSYVFVFLKSGDWLESPTLLPALLYGIATVVFPLFIMQPALGFGIASSKTPNPTKARLKSIATHTVFGVCMYLCAIGINYFLRFLNLNW